MKDDLLASLERLPKRLTMFYSTLDLTLNGDVRAAEADFGLGVGGFGCGKSSLIWRAQLDGLSMPAAAVVGSMRSPVGMQQMLCAVMSRSSDTPLKVSESMLYSGLNDVVLAPYVGRGSLKLMAALAANLMVLKWPWARLYQQHMVTVLDAFHRQFPTGACPHPPAARQLMVHAAWNAFFTHQNFTLPLAMQVGGFWAALPPRAVWACGPVQPASARPAQS
jgi:hypothetical protein